MKTKIFYCYVKVKYCSKIDARCLLTSSYQAFMLIMPHLKITCRCRILCRFICAIGKNLCLSYSSKILKVDDVDFMIYLQKYWMKGPISSVLLIFFCSHLSFRCPWIQLPHFLQPKFCWNEDLLLCSLLLPQITMLLLIKTAFSK